MSLLIVVVMLLLIDPINSNSDVTIDSNDDVAINRF